MSDLIFCSAVWKLHAEYLTFPKFFYFIIAPVVRILLCFLFLHYISCKAQVIKSDTAFLQTSVRKTLDVYTQAMQGRSSLYNGTAYPTYQLLKAGQHPYFISDDWADGSIVYEDELHQDIPLLYDICRDKVVIEHYYSHSLMELINEHISRFTMYKHTFIHLARDEKSNIRDGFYDLLYDGKVKVIARHEKSLQKALKNKEISYYFASRTRYYILMNGIYFQVKTKSSVLSVFKDREKDLKQFLSKNKISFGSNRGKAIARMAEFYDMPKN